MNFKVWTLSNLLFFIKKKKKEKVYFLIDVDGDNHQAVQVT